MKHSPHASIGVRLPADMLDALRRRGAQEDRTVSWLVRQAVERYLADEPKRERHAMAKVSGE